MTTFGNNPFSTPAPTYFTPTGTLTPAAATVPAASSGGFWSGLGNILAPVAQTAGIIAVSKALGNGRQPGTEQFANPLVSAPGSAGQPGTTPVVSGQLLPGISNTTVYLGLGALVAVGVLAVVIAKR